MSKTNQIFKNMILVSLIMIALGLILAAIGYGLGGGQAIQWGVDGIQIMGDLDSALISVDW